MKKDNDNVRHWSEDLNANNSIHITIYLCIVIIFLLFNLVTFHVTCYTYKKVFNNRCTTPEYYAYNINDFHGLKKEKHKFKNDKNYELTSYLYRVDGLDYKSLMVVSHGIGRGHTPYLDIINFFANKGYYVFAYDASGCDESEGVVGGLSQGIIDLDYAINYAKTIEDCKDLPITLFGHSWGAFSVTHVIEYHPEVKGAIEVAGFDNSTELIKYYINEYANPILGGISKYQAIAEKNLFGKYSNKSAITGIKKSNTKVLFLSGDEDKIVPPEYGYEIWKRELKDNDNCKFIMRENRSHGNVYENDNAVKQYKEFIKKLNKYLEENDDTDKTHEELVDLFYKDNWDKQAYVNFIDIEFCNQIESFLDKSLK